MSQNTFQDLTGRYIYNKLYAKWMKSYRHFSPVFDNYGMYKGDSYNRDREVIKCR